MIQAARQRDSAISWQEETGISKGRPSVEDEMALGENTAFKPGVRSNAKLYPAAEPVQIRVSAAYKKVTNFNVRL